ncbi:MAG: 50S ribosomal protein L21 [Planctomycetota bacterium]
MYAIFTDGGHQYRAEKGDRLVLDHRDAAPGDEITFDRVLVLDGEIGQPTVPAAAVKARVLGDFRGEKIHIQKFRRRANYRRRTGHRQRFTEVEITEIGRGA